MWNSSLKKIPQYNFKKFNQNLLKDVLNAVDEYGFCLIKNMPTTKNGIHALTKHIGPIKETNWGNIADIKNIKKAYDLTMTERALENHTDNPYRFPTQGYIFLHCIKNSDVGGENTLADGFNIAKQIKSKNIEMFNILKSFKTFFQYKDKDTILENYCSLIETDYEDNIVQVRYNNRTEIIPYDDLCEINKYTEARSKFWKLIKSKVNNITIKQTSGDMIIMDNYRVLHGRSKYKDIKNQRLKITAFILTQELRSDGIKVKVHIQNFKNNVWSETFIDNDLESKIEESILNEARNLRINSSK